METERRLPEIRKVIILHAPLVKVWAAVSTSDGIAGWWMPNNFEPVMGREFVLHTGQYGDSLCKVTKLTPPYHVSFHWGKDWNISIELKGLERGKTELTLIHDGWDAEKTTEFGQSHTAIREFMNSGWEKMIKEKLPAYIEG